MQSKVWDALRRGDAEADLRLLADDFLGVYPTGFADRSAHAGQLSNGPTVSEFQLLEARLMVLSDNDVLLSYRADWHRFGSPDSDASRVDLHQLAVVATVRPMGERPQPGLPTRNRAHRRLTAGGGVVFTTCLEERLGEA